MKAAVSAELLADVSSEHKNHPMEDVTRAERARWWTPLKKKAAWRVIHTAQLSAACRAHEPSGVLGFQYLSSQNTNVSELVLNLCSA